LSAVDKDNSQPGRQKSAKAAETVGGGSAQDRGAGGEGARGWRGADRDDDDGEEADPWERKVAGAAAGLRYVC